MRIQGLSTEFLNLPWASSDVLRLSLDPSHLPQCLYEVPALLIHGDGVFSDDGMIVVDQNERTSKAQSVVLILRYNAATAIAMAAVDNRRAGESSRQQ